MSIRQKTNWRAKLVSYGLPLLFLAVLLAFLVVNLNTMAQKTAEESLRSTEAGPSAAALLS